MRKEIALTFASVALMVVALAPGCGSKESTSTDEGTGGTGHTDAGGDTGGGGGNDGSSAGDTGPDCSNVSFQASSDPKCDSCAKGKCCGEVIACNNSADCRALNTCLAKCADDDQVCILTCASAHDQGTALAESLGSCISDKCSNDCQAPDAGGGGFDF